MLRVATTFCALGLTLLGGCGHSDFAIRPVPRIAADTVGKPVHLLNDALGTPEKVDATSTKLIYTWFLPQDLAGAPLGFHGCEMEVTVDIRSDRVLGYALANVGWGNCKELQRKVRITDI